MNGATPRGPSVVITKSTTAIAMPSGTGRSCDTAAFTRSAGLCGTNWVTSPPPTARRTGSVIRGEGPDHAVTVRPNRVRAVATESARNNVHAMHTSVNGASRCIQWTRVVSGGSARRPVPTPPGNEVPGGSGPQTSQEQGDHQVHVGAHVPPTVATQGDVEVVAQP